MSDEKVVSVKLSTELVQLVNAYRAYAQRSKEHVRERVTTFDSTVQYIVKFACKEEIRRFEKAKQTTAKNKVKESKLTLTDALVAALDENDNVKAKAIRKQIAELEAK